MDPEDDTQLRARTTLTDEPGGLDGRTIAGKYRVGAKLGAGGMGSVYRATRLLIGDEVAIKILHSGGTDPKAGDRFQREARAAARLKHPNVVGIHDFGITDEGMQYLVMELVEGPSLRQIIKQQGVIEPAAAVEITRQVCDALDDAHQHNVIHRDIKPDNIIVRSTVNGLRVKVLDFGIAKLRDDLAGNLTQTGSILGTPHYMSPEQCLGEELDSRSDIYSLGVVVYEMLTGVVPFHSPSSAVVVQHVTKPPPPLRSLNPAISPAIEFVVLNALNKPRDARPQTAGSFARSFSSALSNPAFPAAANVIPKPSSPGVVPAEPTVDIRGPGGVPPAPNIVRTPSKLKTLGYLGLLAGALILGGAIVSFIRSDGNDNSKPSAVPQVAKTVPLSISATASSTRLPIQTNTYDAANAIDGQRTTAWIEGVNGPGIGEWIQFDFGREIILRRIIIQPGYFKSNQIWNQNNRLAGATIHFSNGASQGLSFSNSMESNQTALERRTSWVRLVITSVHQGTNPGPYDDTGLSEVTFEWEPANTN